VARLARILPFFFITHCSASPDAGMLKGVEKINFESEGDGQPEILRKIGETSDDPKSDSETPIDFKPQTNSKSPVEIASASPSANQDTSQPAPKPSQTGGQPQNQLPNINVESDKALLPIASTIAQEGAPLVLPGQIAPIVDLYSYLGMSSDTNYSLSCSIMRVERDSGYKPSSIVCSLVDSSLVRVNVVPTEMIWSVSVTKCPKALITGNVMTSGCVEGGAVSECQEITPAAKVNFGDTDLAKCIGDGSQLIFTIKNVSTDARATMTMTLTTTTDESLFPQPITRRY
jgi:hypothetical protein